MQSSGLILGRNKFSKIEPVMVIHAMIVWVASSPGVEEEKSPVTLSFVSHFGSPDHEQRETR